MKTIAIAAAVPALAFGVSACSDSGSSDSGSTNTAPATEQAADAAGSATAKAGDVAESATAKAGEVADSAKEKASDVADSAGKPKVLLNGKTVNANFDNVTCNKKTDDGQDELKLKAGQDGSKLELEIKLGDPNVLDSLDLKVDGVEWETSDAQEREAKVIKTGDQYTVSTKVHEDDNESNTADVEVTFNCKA